MIRVPSTGFEGLPTSHLVPLLDPNGDPILDPNGDLILVPAGDPAEFVSFDLTEIRR